MKRLLFVAGALVATGCTSTQPQRTTQNYPEQTNQAQRQVALIGPRGPDGPAGATGAQGPTGQTGPAGVARAGARGPTGPAGAVGSQGQMGAQGPTGEVVAGPAGAVGPAGDTGPQGVAGATGAQGESTPGYAGAAGPAGPTGAPGPTGLTGAKGPTLVGPAGPAGRAGVTGAQGTRGQVGAQGGTTAGVAGAVGAAGGIGPQGEIGPTGPQGQTGVIDRWVSYREFWFDANQSTMTEFDSNKVAEIAAYMKQNPSLQLGIDNSVVANSNNRTNTNLATHRINAVRDALIAAGVPANRMSEGNFGDSSLRRDGRVEVLIKTDQLAKAPASPPVVAANNDRWNSYRDFWFDVARADIHPADASKMSEIAAYMKENPSLQIGIDSSLNPSNHDQASIELAARRGTAVRDGLIAAGVPAANIKSGTFGKAEFRREGRVEVLVPTDEVALHNPSSPGTHWKTYDDFAFESERTVIHGNDMDKVTRIAAYMKANPSYQLGIDGSTNPRATDWYERDLCSRRVEVIRDALITAGVPAGRISDGMLGDANLRRAGRVEILMLDRSDQLAQAATSPSSVGESWSSYRDFWFDPSQCDIHPADAHRVTEIAAFLEENPSVQLGIDSSVKLDGNNQRSMDELATRRGNSVRDALIDAGIDANRISEGAFGKVDFRREGRVEVFVRTDQMAHAK